MDKPRRRLYCHGARSGCVDPGENRYGGVPPGGPKALWRNPYNFAHTPGGSSSGSGAAVGDFHVPLAFGTQTGGSHIRPATFNGIYGIKPTWNLLSREGVRMSSITLDTVGWYGRSIEDLILVGTAYRLAA